MGVVCEKFCKFGILIVDYICDCDDCYNGFVCDMFCLNYSLNCVNKKCDCGFDGWCGNYCEKKGCFGYKKDCLGYG